MEREIDPNVTEVPEIPTVLSSLLVYAVEEGERRFNEQGSFTPFTALAVGEKLFIEALLDTARRGGGDLLHGFGETHHGRANAIADLAKRAVPEFLEEVDGETPEEMYAFAKHTVEHVRGADAYALCYDGYLDTDQGMRDAIIAEGGVPGAIQGEAVGLLYEMDADGNVEYHRPIAYIGKAPNFMIFLTDDTDPLKVAAEDEEANEGDEG